jgi:predicted amidophosphoribosyltransferase
MRVAAADALLAVLEVPDPTWTSGARVLVYDDVCTTGHQPDRVARVLQDVGGADQVEGLVMARTPSRER